MLAVALGVLCTTCYQVKPGVKHHDLPFTSATLVFRNISFSVMVNEDGQRVPKTLLRGISGYAKPGTLTALMGATGAGKTTLLDVRDSRAWMLLLR